MNSAERYEILSHDKKTMEKQKQAQVSAQAQQHTSASCRSPEDNGDFSHCDPFGPWPFYKGSQPGAGLHPAKRF